MVIIYTVLILPATLSKPKPKHGHYNHELIINEREEEEQKSWLSQKNYFPLTQFFCVTFTFYFLQLTFLNFLNNLFR